MPAPENESDAWDRLFDALDREHAAGWRIEDCGRDPETGQRIERVVRVPNAPTPITDALIGRTLCQRDGEAGVIE